LELRIRFPPGAVLSMVKESKVVIWDDIVMMLLALVSGYLLVLEYTTTLAPDQVRLFNAIDLGISLIFLAEFCIKFFIAKKKGSFFKSHWWELLASIPVTTPLTQGLRLLRLLRLFRLMRLTEGVQEVGRYMEDFFEHTYFLYLFTVWVVLIFSSSLAFYSFEYGKNPNVHGFFDSFWWAMATVTTIGYGDVYPITTAGRVVAIFLMVMGIGTTGLFTALIASFLIKKNRA
jgi:voltage-gated potassium channel